MSQEESSDEDSLLSDSDNESTSIRGKSTGVFLEMRGVFFVLFFFDGSLESP